MFIYSCTSSTSRVIKLAKYFIYWKDEEWKLIQYQVYVVISKHFEISGLKKLKKNNNY